MLTNLSLNNCKPYISNFYLQRCKRLKINVLYWWLIELPYWFTACFCTKNNRNFNPAPNTQMINLVTIAHAQLNLVYVRHEVRLSHQSDCSLLDIISMCCTNLQQMYLLNKVRKWTCSVGGSTTNSFFSGLSDNMTLSISVSVFLLQVTVSLSAGLYKCTQRCKTWILYASFW